MASTAFKSILCGCIVLLFGNGFSAMARSTASEADKSVALLQQHLCRDECSKKVCNMYMHHMMVYNKLCQILNEDQNVQCTTFGSKTQQKKNPTSFICRINEDSSSNIEIHLHWFLPFWNSCRHTYYISEYQQKQHQEHYLRIGNVM